MRFVVAVDAAWNVTVRAPGARDPLAQRKLRRATATAFPLPPEDALPMAGDSHYELCTDVTGRAAEARHHRIVSREIDRADVESFGRYLFQTLLGEQAWRKVVAAAKAAWARRIELALSWPRSEAELSRLSWELLRGPDGFLAAGRPIPTAITRILPGGAAPRSIDAPPRVLFVVGGSPGDAALRPGARFLGLLHQMRCAGGRIRSEVLLQATPNALESALARFAPDVVHFVCQAGVDAMGAAYLELCRELSEREGRAPGRRPVSAKQLLQLLRVGSGPPPIVVLGACMSGVTLIAEQMAPLAAELVAGGVPIVVGMSGRLSDLACRLFARRFGEALVDGEPLVGATEEGRRAAFSRDVPTHRSADWAFPMVFLSDAVPEAYGTQTARAEASARVEAWIESFGLVEDPLFCGRYELIEASRELFEADRSTVLAVYTEPVRGLGKSRLLRELAALALRDGNVPCLLGARAPTDALPRTAEELCEHVSRAVAEARRALGLDEAESAVQSLLLGGADALRPFTRPEDEIDLAAVRPADLLRWAMKADLGGLVRAARGAHAHFAKARALVLFDDVHLYGQAALEALLDRVLGPHGLGQLGDTVPVVMAFAMGSPADPALRQVIETQRGKGWLRAEPLRVFGEDGEDMLAYERVLLHPYGNDSSPGAPGVPWAFDYGIDPRAVETWEARFRRRLGGLPMRLADETFYVLAEAAESSGFTVRADDHAALEDLRGRS